MYFDIVVKNFHKVVKAAFNTYLGLLMRTFLIYLKNYVSQNAHPSAWYTV